MWDTVSENHQHLSHDVPCPRCGHEVHAFFSCDHGCDCAPYLLPGSTLPAC